MHPTLLNVRQAAASANREPLSREAPPGQTLHQPHGDTEGICPRAAFWEHWASHPPQFGTPLPNWEASMEGKYFLRHCSIICTDLFSPGAIS